MAYHNALLSLFFHLIDECIELFDVSFFLKEILLDVAVVFKGLHEEG